MATQKEALIIYGATGYTGRLACEHAKNIGLHFVVAGRSEAKLKLLATKHQVSYRVFDVDDTTATDAALAGRRVLLNCAGPFMRTAEPLISACLDNNVHYLDIAAELDSYILSQKMDDEARRMGVMLLPGCGGSVAMLGCLVGYALEGARRPAKSIDIALHVSGSMSRGSAMSAAENLTIECLERSEGRLGTAKSPSPLLFNFGDGRGDVSAFPVTLPDLITLGKSTCVPNIRTFVNVSGDAFPTENLDMLPEGPTKEQRDANPYHAAAVVKLEDGKISKSVLHTVNGYTFTPIASVEAAQLVLRGEYQSGFQTPAIVFGNRFVEIVKGSRLQDI